MFVLSWGALLKNWKIFIKVFFSIFSQKFADTNVMLVKVKKHKTYNIHGAAKIPFVLEGLFEACLAYKEAWRGSAQEDGFLFATPSGNPGRYTACIR